MFLRELALEVGRKPDAGEWPTLLEQSLGIEHGALSCDGAVHRTQQIREAAVQAAS
jgi:hypothetical protein